MIPIREFNYNKDTKELTGVKRKRKLPNYLHSLMACFFDNRGKIIPMMELIDIVCGDKELVYNYICRLNKMLDFVDGTVELRNSYGDGYRLTNK